MIFLRGMTMLLAITAWLAFSIAGTFGQTWSPAQLPNFSNLTSQTEVDPRKFDTLEEAALYAEKAAYDKNYTVEIGGMILKTKDGKYQFTIGNTDYSEDSVNIHSVEIYEDSVAVAQYHDHPCVPYSHIPSLFSMPDIALAMRAKQIAIVADLCSGEIHEWDGSRDAYEDVAVYGTFELGLPFFQTTVLTRGRIVGTIPLTKNPVILETAPTTGEQFIFKNVPGKYLTDKNK